MFQSLTRDSNHSNMPGSTPRHTGQMFQSLTRDSNHSNTIVDATRGRPRSFNPSRGIAIIQTWLGAGTPSVVWEFQSLTRDSNHSNFNAASSCSVLKGFNPSRGIAIIQTSASWSPVAATRSFNPSRGIAIIQTARRVIARENLVLFQSLTRDSNHSNISAAAYFIVCTACFNPSRGIAIIQTFSFIAFMTLAAVSIPHAG